MGSIVKARKSIQRPPEDEFANDIVSNSIERNAMFMTFTE
jgi:hypothetical protein